MESNYLLVYNYTIVPKIYENIENKVSKNERDKEKVKDFMKLIQSSELVEKLKIRPR